MTRRPGCRAYQVSDQMTCPTCGLTWDMNDPAPPPCAPARAITRRRGRYNPAPALLRWHYPTRSQ